ncbi:hypothetical protein Q4I32_002188 [Leishmania shawi]|uniref:Uncharacterized protein n=1 Tax=Leishmania shawi TaxID=5680 RepID=A0AAW3C525_9TRYP
MNSCHSASFGRACSVCVCVCVCISMETVDRQRNYWPVGESALSESPSEYAPPQQESSMQLCGNLHAHHLTRPTASYGWKEEYIYLYIYTSIYIYISMKNNHQLHTEQKTTEIGWERGERASGLDKATRSLLCFSHACALDFYRFLCFELLEEESGQCPCVPAPPTCFCQPSHPSPRSPLVV